MVNIQDNINQDEDTSILKLCQEISQKPQKQRDQTIFQTLTNYLRKLPQYSKFFTLCILLMKKFFLALKNIEKFNFF